ncbi:MAG: gluconate 2-dehydrogenase subunit 3 family protein [Thaumarchaeota archaeon]|nr:gluconate 2-dehydrogenase subunit 3 family protein [Nitrososphaerota archaeon]
MSSRRNFIKVGAAAVAGAAVASAVEIPLMTTQVQQKDQALQQKEQTITQLQSQAEETSRLTGFLSLTPKQREMVEAIAETMIPTDNNGAGAKEAGVIYFIDRHLAGSYGKSGNMYLQGPFVPPNQTGPITVEGQTYPKGTISARINAGTGYQYPFTLKEYWRRGLEYLDAYSRSAYGGTFENLEADQRTLVLQDLWDNKPTNFDGPTPREFFYELHDMMTAGFFTDPLYGGNRGMVSWELTGYAGTNDGASEGFTLPQLMVMDEPQRLKPMSLADIQQGGSSHA